MMKRLFQLMADKKASDIFMSVSSPINIKINGTAIAVNQQVMDANLIPCVLHVLRTSEFRTKKEAAWAISNLTTGGTVYQIQFLVQQGCIPPLVDLLTLQDAKVIQITLDALLNILKAGDLADGTNPCADFLEEAGGVEIVEALQEHENEDIYKKSLEIIEGYFGEGEDGETGTAPQIGANGFAFSAQAPVAVGGFNF